jgi:hypothetical protein
MAGLTSEQLMSVRALVTEPLVETVRAEMRAYHEQAAAAQELTSMRIAIISKLADAHDLDIKVIKAKVAKVETVKRVGRLVSHAAMLAFGTALSAISEWFAGRHR